MAVWGAVSLASSPAPSIAQLPTIRFQRFGMEDGLSHPFGYVLLESSEGFIWVGTQDGLNRFDGYSFVTFRHDAADSATLSDDYIRSLYEDAAGNLWVGTVRGGLNRLDPITGVSVRYPLTDLGPWRSPTGELYANSFGRTVGAIIGMDRSLLVATDAGLVRLSSADGTYELLDHGLGGPAGPVTALHLEGTRLWLGRGDGRVDILPLEADTVVKTGVVTSALALPAVISAFEPGRPGTMWISTTGAGAFEVATSDLRILRHLSHHSSDPSTLPNARVQDLLLDASGHLWIATLEGLSILELDRGTIGHFRSDDAAPYTLPDPQVYSFLEDRQGSVWVGTWNGVARASPYRSAFSFFPRRGAAGAGLSEGVVAIEEEESGNLWVGTFDGLDLLDPDSAVVQHVASDPQNERMLSHGAVYGLDTDADGALWIATFGGGVNRLDRTSGIVTRMGPGAVDGAGVRATSVFVDRAGVIWAGTQFDGLQMFDVESQRFVRFRGPAGDWSFGSDYVWPIVEDRHGNLWVGAFEGGISRIDSTRSRIELYTPDNSGLADSRILTLYADPTGMIWIGTQGGGLYRFDPETRSFTVYTTRDGLPHDHVQGIATDERGFLWISTNGGLARFDQTTEEFWTFRAESGLQGDRFFANSVLEGRHGQLYFGGAGGLTGVDPSRIDKGHQPPPLVLTRFFIHNEERPLGAWREGSTTLVLEPGDNFFAFEFTSLDFTDPSENIYRYRLDPLDRGWNESGNRRMATYTSVPPGRYTFLVSAANSEGIWNHEGLRVPVRVESPYYATWWFRLVIFSMLGGLLAAGYTYRTRERLRLQELRLGIAGKLHDDIGANLSAITLKSELAARSAGLDEEGKSILVDVGHLARTTIEAVRDTVWVVNTDHDTLGRLVRKMEDTADLQLGGHVKHTFSAPSDLPERRIGWELRQDIYFLFKEALTNIIKHSGADDVRIQLSYAAPELRLIIVDNGVGFNLDGDGMGNGLNSMRRRASRHSGVLSVDTQPGMGTRLEARIRIH